MSIENTRICQISRNVQAAWQANPNSRFVKFAYGRRVIESILKISRSTAYHIGRLGGWAASIFISASDFVSRSS